MKESTILSALIKSRKAYEEIQIYAKEEDFSSQGFVIYTEIQDFYNADQAVKSCDREILLDRIERRLDNPKHFDMFKTLFKTMPEDVSSVNVTKEFVATRLHVLGLKLSHALASGSDFKEVWKLKEDWENLAKSQELDTDDDVEVSVGKLVEDVLPTFDAGNMLTLYPSELNERIGGGLVGGDHLFAFGRPEVGKTAHALTFLRRPAKAGNTVLYIGNEDAHFRVLQRALCSFSGLNWEEAIANPGLANKKAKENGYDNVVFVSLVPGTVPQIEELVERHHARLCVIDQVGNIFSKSDNKTLQLGGVMQGVRNIGKRHNCAMISFWQAGDSATNKLVLEMEDVNWSNTDMQAACDIMVGIGMDQEYDRRDQRCMSLCKNKPTGDHGYFNIAINKKISRVSTPR
jgi:NifU-like protein involved in Fe-S cluster formation